MKHVLVKGLPVIQEGKLDVNQQFPPATNVF